jgi:hypothetical protein
MSTIFAIILVVIGYLLFVTFDTKSKVEKGLRNNPNYQEPIEKKLSILISRLLQDGLRLNKNDHSQLKFSGYTGQKNIIEISISYHLDNNYQFVYQIFNESSKHLRTRSFMISINQNSTAIYYTHIQFYDANFGQY